MLDSAIINTSLPQMAASFGVKPTELSIGITTYTLTVAALVPLSGWMADRFGGRNIFLASILIFTLASLGCGMSTSLPQFVAARVAQGIGGAMMTPVGRLIVIRNASKSELLAATSLITWPALFAPVIGPLIGGFITTWFSWHWNFLLNIPLGLIGIVLAARFIPDQRESMRRSFDRLGFILSSGAMICLLCGLETLAHGRAGGAIMPASLVVAGIALTVLAVRHFRRVQHPLLDLSAFQVQTFALSSLAAGTFLRVAIAATPFLLPLMFQVGFGMSAMMSGMLIFAYFVGNLGMKSVTTPILRRFGFRNVLFINGMLAGLSVMACGFLGKNTPLWLMVLVLVLAGLTRSMQLTALSTVAFADVGAAQRGSASTLSSMLQQMAMVLGVALATLIVNTSETVRGAHEASIVDFRAAFLIVGFVGLLASLRFLGLPADAGAEVSGHKFVKKTV
jgi:EmrB/QacA subfamily drug resistance transporter